MLVQEHILRCEPRVSQVFYAVGEDLLLFMIGIVNPYA